MNLIRTRARKIFLREKNGKKNISPCAYQIYQNSAEPEPVSGHLVLQDEGQDVVTLDVYATGRRQRLARITVRREVLALYASELLRAFIRKSDAGVGRRSPGGSGRSDARVESADPGSTT